MIGTSLRMFLLADPAVSVLVGGERIHPVVLPQGASEASVSYRRISGRGVHGTAGRLNLNGSRIQIDAYARSVDEASELADAIRDRIDGYRGAVGSTRFKGVFLANESDLFDPDVKMHRVSRDYFVWFSED
jgi:hypothetical protein